MTSFREVRYSRKNEKKNVQTLGSRAERQQQARAGNTARGPLDKHNKTPKQNTTSLPVAVSQQRSVSWSFPTSTIIFSGFTCDHRNYHNLQRQLRLNGCTRSRLLLISHTHHLFISLRVCSCVEEPGNDKGGEVLARVSLCTSQHSGRNTDTGKERFNTPAVNL